MQVVLNPFIDMDTRLEISLPTEDDPSVYELAEYVFKPGEQVELTDESWQSVENLYKNIPYDEGIAAQFDALGIEYEYKQRKSLCCTTKYYLIRIIIQV